MEIEINERDFDNRKKMIAFELPQLWYDALKSGADTEMQSVSNLIRIILYKHYIAERLEERNIK